MEFVEGETLAQILARRRAGSFGEVKGPLDTAQVDLAYSVRIAEAVKLYPDEPWSRYVIAWVLARKGDVEAAAAAFLESLAFSPDWWNSNRDLARLLRSHPEAPVAEGEDLARALEALERSARESAEKPYVLRTLALLELRRGAPSLSRARAWALALRAAKMPQDYQAEVPATMAEVELAAGGSEGAGEAVRLLEEALDLPGATPRQRALLEEYRKSIFPLLPSFGSIDSILDGDGGPEVGEEALLAGFEGASGSGSEAHLRYLKGRLFRRSGRLAEAIEELEAASRLEPARPEPHLQVAECLAASGAPDLAEKRLREVLAGGSCRHRSIMERWATLCLLDLGLAPGDALARLPESPGVQEEPGVLGDLRWLLGTLAAGNAIRIDCGADRPYQGVGGEVWGRDRYAIGGRLTRPWWSQSNASTEPYSREILKTDDDPLYRTERWFPAEELPGGYRVPLPRGTYRVTLHFALIRHMGLGCFEVDLDRIGEQMAGPASFDVTIEGKAVLEGYRPVDHGLGTADAQSFRTEVTDGILEIRFLPRVGDPAVSAFEVEQVSVP